MNAIKNILLPVLALVAIGASVIAWRQYGELTGLRAAAMKPAERADFQKRAWDSEKRARQLETQLAAIRSQLGDGSALPATAIDAAAPGNPQGRVIGDVINGWLSVMNDPEAQRLMAEQQRAQISSRYAELFRALALPPEKVAALKALLLEKQMVRNDVLMAATQQGINPLSNPQEFRQLERNLESEIDRKIEGTLGSNGYAEFQTYQQTQGQRGVVKQLEESLSYTPTPLSTAQSQQMVQILGQTGPGAARNTPNKNNSTVTNDTVASAQNVLSPPQLQALKDIQLQQQSGAELNRLMRARQVDIPGMSGAMNGGNLMTPGRGGRGG